MLLKNYGFYYLKLERVRFVSQGGVDVIAFVPALNHAAKILNFIADIGLKVVFAPISNGQLVNRKEHFNLCSFCAVPMIVVVREFLEFEYCFLFSVSTNLV